MDGKGRALDNVWIERFWKSVKYDYIFLNPADDGVNSPIFDCTGKLVFCI